MKTLYVLRHAKSSWNVTGVGDHARPLDDRGERVAALVAAYLEQREIVPSLVLCSSATRTCQTLDRIRPVLPSGTPIEIDEDLYLASVRQLLDRLAALPGSISSVLLIGHNPGLAQLTLQLASGPDRLVGQVRDKFPTAALATVELPIGQWTDVVEASGELTDFCTPKSLV
jgi:phosphohistidine phosphatase